jgi:hypothetical protein
MFHLEQLCKSTNEATEDLLVFDGKELARKSKLIAEVLDTVVGITENIAPDVLLINCSQYPSWVTDSW